MIHSPPALRHKPQATFRRAHLSVRVVAAVRGGFIFLADAFTALSAAFGFIVFMLGLTFGTLWFVAWMVEQLRGAIA